MKNHLLSLYRYTFWADAQLFDSAAQLSDAQLKQDWEYSIGSVWNHCYHLWRVEYWWFVFLRTGQMPPEEAPEREDIAWVREQWEANCAAILAYIESVTDAELNRLVKPPHWDEEDRPIPVWKAMIQVANHSTDHRAQALRLLHDLGAPTFGQDYLRYLDTEE